MDMNLLKNSSTISIDEALRASAPLSFNLMIKPLGSTCNLRCRYCYYLDKKQIYGIEPVMSEDLLDAVIKQYSESVESDYLQFNWHGGEPLILGMDYFRKILEIERKYSNGRTVSNTLQTNGTLLDRAWADFLSENGFLTGLSIDGPVDIHDGFRSYPDGKSSFDAVVNATEYLLAAGAEFNALTTVNSLSKGRGKDVYLFLKSLGIRYIQFLPVLEYIKDDRIVAPGTVGSRIAEWSVNPYSFGEFLCDVFDCWVRNDVGSIFVNQFDSALASWCSVNPGSCTFCTFCGSNAVVEHNGDVYPCDHFVYPEYLLGNVRSTHLRQICKSSQMLGFSWDKYRSLSEKCLRCEFLFACNGECPKHRYGRDAGTDAGRNVLCEGYRMFYSHAAPYMDRMRDLILKKMPPSLIMNEV